MAEKRHRETSRHIAAFEVWYAHGRDYEKTLASLKAAGEKISSRTLYRWAEWFKWHDRADKLDAEAARRRMEQSVQEQVEMLKRKAGVGRLLQKQALEYLKQNGISNQRDALYAIRLGFEMEQSALGLPEIVELVMGATDEKKIRAIYEAALDELAALSPEVGRGGSTEGEAAEASYPPIAIAPLWEDDKA